MTRGTKKRGVTDAETKAVTTEETTEGKSRGESSKGMKRGKKSSELPPPKRTLSGQKSLLSFSTASPPASQVDLVDDPVKMEDVCPGVDSYPKNSGVVEGKPSAVEGDPGTVEVNPGVAAPVQSRKELNAAWKSVFGSGPKAPPCSGHKEPCVLRTVKKQGPNKNRQFWVCARPMGSKEDPQARCDFFKWVKEKKK